MKFFVGHEFSLPGQPIVLMQQRIQAATWRNQAAATDRNKLAPQIGGTNPPLQIQSRIRPVLQSDCIPGQGDVK